MVFVASKTVSSMSERFKVVLDHARRYTISVRLYLFTFYTLTVYTGYSVCSQKNTIRKCAEHFDHRRSI